MVLVVGSRRVARAIRFFLRDIKESVVRQRQSYDILRRNADGLS
jgi:hypothetical protein